MLEVNDMNSWPVAERFERFDNLVSDAFFPMSCERPGADLRNFNAAIKTTTLQQLGFAAIRSSPLDVYRRHSHISRATDAVYMVKIQVEGESTVRQRGREAQLKPGDFTLCSSNEPYELHFQENYSQIVLSVPQQLLAECVRQPESHLGQRMAAQVGANGLFTQFVITLGRQIDSMNATLLSRLEANVIDLLATALGHAQEDQKQDMLNNGVKIEYLKRIKHYIRRHLVDEQLCPHAIAAAHDISTRYLHMLFEGEGESVSRYILRLRLESCGNALADSRNRKCSVSEIGFRFGFNDASHFSRAFKAQFGTSPARFRNDQL